jgi:hypothetical protein
MKSCRIALTAILALCNLSFAQEPTIVSFERNGVLSWTNTPLEGEYTIEWASGLTNEWRSDWSGLYGIAATNQEYSVEVPMFFRVRLSECGKKRGVQVLGTGDGTLKHFSGTLTNRTIIHGGVYVTSGAELWSDPDGDGVMTSSIQVPTGNGTIDYRSQDVAVTFTAPVPLGEEVLAVYEYNDCPSLLNSEFTTQIATGSGIDRHFSSVLDKTPLVPGSVTVTDGYYFLTDDGVGNLSGSQGSTGSIHYFLGVVQVEFVSRPPDGTPILVNYDHSRDRPSMKKV